MTKTQPATILVVEDEPRLVRLIRAILETADYRVITVPNGERAIEQAVLEHPDLILLDLLLPGPLDGYAVAERIRQFSMVPIIMVTARSHEEERLRGFEAGADDYVTKPFSARELLARVQAVLRRTRVPVDGLGRLKLGEITIDLAAQEVTGPEGPIHFAPTELRLLMTLARHHDHAMTHTDLLQEVWGSEFRDQLDYLRTYIRYLRKKIEPDPANPRYILTVPGVGYRLATTGREGETPS